MVTSLKTKTLASEILDFPLQSQSGETITLGSLLESPCLLIFLRHFGCIGCAAHLTQLSPRLNEFLQKDFRIILIGNGDSQFIDGFKERFALKDQRIHVLTDTSLKLYQLFNLERSWTKTFGFSSFVKTWKLFAKGLSNKEMQGDSIQQGGSFIVDTNYEIQFAHVSSYVGDNADISEMMEVATKIYLQKSQVLEP